MSLDKRSGRLFMLQQRKKLSLFSGAAVVVFAGVASAGFAAPAIDQTYFYQQDLESDHMAAFAEASFGLTNRLTPTAGAYVLAGLRLGAC